MQIKSTAGKDAANQDAECIHLSADPDRLFQRTVTLATFRGKSPY